MAHGNNITRRKGTKNLSLQLRLPRELLPYVSSMPGLQAKQVISLGTADPEEAERRARLPRAEWKNRMDMILSVFKGTMQVAEDVAKMQIPGQRVEAEDGKYWVANDQQRMLMSADGNSVLEVQPNIDIGRNVSIIFPQNNRSLRYDAFVPKGFITKPSDFARLADVQPKVKSQFVRDIDMEIIDNWAKEGDGVDPRFVKEAYDLLKFWREHIPGKTFSNADWEDGRALDEALKEKLGNKSATRRKKLAFFRRAFFLAKRRQKTFPSLVGRENPFSGVVNMEDDALDKEMFDDLDTALIKSRMHELGSNERTLLTWCLATGCRRSEPFEITGEKQIDGFRTIRFGRKTPASDRTIPLPPVLLELYPEPITGPLFSDSEINIGKNINKWLRKIGITDPSKTLHSTRHRASYQLRKVVKRDSERHECLGHESRNEASEGYGAYPQCQLNAALSRVW